MMPENRANKHRDFMRLYEPVKDSFYRYCRSRALGIMETDDLVNDTILAVYEKFESIKIEKAFKSYLFSAAGRIALNALRRKKFSKDDPFAELSVIAGDNPEVLTDYILVTQEINRLPENQREALILFEVSGFSIAEICDIQNAKESAVKQRLRRARNELKKKLSGEKSEPELNEIIMSIFL